MCGYFVHESDLLEMLLYKQISVSDLLISTYQYLYLSVSVIHSTCHVVTIGTKRGRTITSIEHTVFHLLVLQGIKI